MKGHSHLCHVANKNSWTMWTSWLATISPIQMIYNFYKNSSMMKMSLFCLLLMYLNLIKTMKTLLIRCNGYWKNLRWWACTCRVCRQALFFLMIHRDGIVWDILILSLDLSLELLRLEDSHNMAILNQFSFNTAKNNYLTTHTNLWPEDQYLQTKTINFNKHLSAEFTPQLSIVKTAALFPLQPM